MEDEEDLANEEDSVEEEEIEEDMVTEVVEAEEVAMVVGVRPGQSSRALPSICRAMCSPHK